jgi:hypothetical protein
VNTHFLLRSLINLLQLFLQVNFNASVIFLLIASVLTLSGSELIIASDQDLYGPLVNNMRFVLFYLCLMEVAVYSMYRAKKGYAAVLIFGVFFLFLMGSLEFYCQINQIEVDGNYQQIFMYVGLSHALYGGIRVLRESSNLSNTAVSANSLHRHD